MFNKRIVTALLALLLFGGSNFAAAETPPAQVIQQVQDAATGQLQREAEANGWLAPKFDVNVVRGSRPLASCAGAVTVKPVDTRQPTRMRFDAICPAAAPDGWRYEFVVRALVSAEVLVAALDIPANQVLAADDVMLQRHDISGIADSVNDVQAVLGLRGKRTLRSGDVLRLGVLAQPDMIKRGQVEVSMAGEALDNGARGAVVRVRNANGTVIQARVKAAGLVEPADMPSTQSPD